MHEYCSCALAHAHYSIKPSSLQFLSFQNPRAQNSARTTFICLHLLASPLSLCFILGPLFVTCLALSDSPSRTQLDSPAICLPGLSRPSVAVRCSPRLYKARSGGAASLQPPASPTGVSGLNDIDTHR